MEITVGSVVFSKAGHDKGDVFLVVSLEKEYAYVSDGKFRKIEKPKKKKLKHLQGTNTVTDKVFKENYQVRSILTEYLKTV